MALYKLLKTIMYTGSSAAEKNGQIVTLRSAPLNVAPALSEALFSRHTGAVLTSATLSNGQNMDSYQSKVGGDGAETQIESSPFNYNKNCRIYIATDSPLPEPGARSA